MDGHVEGESHSVKTDDSTDSAAGAIPLTPGRAAIRPPPNAGSSREPDVEALRAALARERDSAAAPSAWRSIQTDAVQLALDLLVREPDIDGFFGAFIKTLVEECESHACGVWLIDDGSAGRAPVDGVRRRSALHARRAPTGTQLALPRESMAAHLFAYTAGWTETVEYAGDDPRLPEPVRAFNRDVGVAVARGRAAGARRRATLGWIALSTGATSDVRRRSGASRCSRRSRGRRRWRCIRAGSPSSSRVEERRKAILEERNRLARDIHDTWRRASPPS